MRKTLIALAVFFGLTTSAFAEYIMVIPQKPGGGTSVWGEIVAGQLEKHLGEKIVLKHYPGARDIPGFNKWHNTMRDDDKVIMVSHGGNGVAFLQENVDYNYAEYESIGLMNLNIIAGKLKGADMTNPSFAAGSGMVPEAFAMTMLICGPDKSIAEYTACFKEHVTWVPGMSGGERRLAFKRGELNGTRENPRLTKNTWQQMKMQNFGFITVFYNQMVHTQTILTIQISIRNFIRSEMGCSNPSGEMYDAYKLVKSFRDGLQKALWVNAGNPNAPELIAAMEKMAADPINKSNC